MDKFTRYLNTAPGATLIGAILISLSILVSSGVIKIKGLNDKSPAGPESNTAVAQGAPAAPQAPTAPTPPPKVDVTLGNLPVKGDTSAKVAVVEFADMRCPFCKSFFDNSEPQLLTDYVNTSKIKFAFRHFEFLGPASITAGNAVECAREQGKFWEMHDYLYKNQPSESDTSMYNTAKLSSVASDLGMNADQFKTCLDSTKYSRNLTDDQADGQKTGVSGTPSFIIGALDASGNKIVGGQLIVGAVPYATIKTAIDQALGK